ncbi:hypothetical protein [Streptomyces mutomycini]|uniref:hypothetical protein n=1 Tax=Streptomyces mutomycini TaxID=284036 RepID=UPI0033C75958
MRFAGCVKVTGVVLAALMAAGCGGTAGEVAPQGDKKPAQARTSSPSASSVKTDGRVLEDFRFATAGGERFVVVEQPEWRPRGRAVDALSLGPTVPGVVELHRVVERLEQRGWERDGEATVDEGSYLTSGDWLLIVGVGPVPDESMEQAGANKGVVMLSASGGGNSR